MDFNYLVIGCFTALILVLLTLDLGLFNKKPHVPSIKHSIYWTIFYVTIGFGFSLLIYQAYGAKAFKDYLTGFVVEKFLAIDNIFVISVIFTVLHIPVQYQHRILFYGILGAVIFRAILVWGGSALLSHIDAMMYVFAAFIILTGVKMAVFANKKPNIENNILMKIIAKYAPLTTEVTDESFFKVINGKRYLTPCFVALLLIEFMDVVFAIDSIPAIFSITSNPVIVYTSNIFAILGLRSMYFLLDATISKYHYIKYSLSGILIFIGSKIFLSEIFDLHISPDLALVVTISILLIGVAYSIYKHKVSDA